MNPLRLFVALLFLLGLSDSARAQAEFEKIQAGDGSAGEQFGDAVALAGGVALIGAPLDDEHGTLSGSAYVYRRSGTSFTFEQKLSPQDGASLDAFGEMVAVSGERALVGARFDDDQGDDSGSAYIFRFDGAEWALEQKLGAADGAAGDHFGESVALWGTAALVGAPADDHASGADAGSAYVYRFDGTSWVQEAVLQAPDGDGSEGFGSAVALSGDTALVGAPCAGPSCEGAAYVFRFDGATWTPEAKLVASAASTNFGASVGLSGEAAIVGGSSVPRRAFIYRRSAATWAPEATLEGSDQGASFLSSVALSGDIAVTGAPGDVAGGSATFYRFSGTAWVAVEQRFDPGATPSSFGDQVAFDGAVGLVGAPGDDSATGASYAVTNLPEIVEEPEDDADGDGIPDGQDACPRDAANDADQDGLCGNEVLYFSPASDMMLGGVPVYDEDVVRFEEATGRYSRFFFGSQVGLYGRNQDEDVDALHMRADGSLLLSFESDVPFLPGIGSVADDDVVRFVPSTMGATTSGTWERFFVGNEHGLNTRGDDIGGVSEDEDGTLYLSFRSNLMVGGLAIADEDIAIVDPATNTYSKYFDGSDVGIPAERSIDAFDLQPDGTILLSFDDVLNVALPGLPNDGTVRNVVRFIPTSLGPSTAGSFAPFFVGARNGAPPSLNVDAFFRKP